MSLNQPISGLEVVKNIPQNSTYIVEMGDGSGTKAVTQETVTKETGKALKIGNLEELETENKGSIVAAINEAAQSGGSSGGNGNSSVDILDSKEEIEANTEPNKVAGAQAVKEMFGELNNNLGGNKLIYNGSEDAYYIQHGADAALKKLGSGSVSLPINYLQYFSVTGVVYIGFSVDYVRTCSVFNVIYKNDGGGYLITDHWDNGDLGKKVSAGSILNAKELCADTIYDNKCFIVFHKTLISPTEEYIALEIEQ